MVRVVLLLSRLVRRDCVATMLGLLALTVLAMISVQMLSIGVRGHSDDVPASANQLRDCYRSLARAYHEQNPRDSSPEAEDFRRRGWRLLSAVVRALDRLQIPHWLGSGSLLGFARQCDMVPAMGDVDVEVAAEALWSQNVTIQALVDAATAEGARLRHMFGQPSDSMELSFEDGNGTRLDVFVSYPAAEGSRWIGGIDTTTLQKYKWTYPDFELCWSLLDGLRVGIPCEPTGYLRAFYGPDWSSPPPAGVWNYRTGHPNVFNNGYWPETKRAEVFQSFEV